MTLPRESGLNHICWSIIIFFCLNDLAGFSMPVKYFEGSLKIILFKVHLCPPSCVPCGTTLSFLMHSQSFLQNTFLHFKFCVQSISFWLEAPHFPSDGCRRAAWLCMRDCMGPLFYKVHWNRTEDVRSGRRPRRLAILCLHFQTALFIGWIWTEMRFKTVLINIFNIIPGIII